jgi:putative transposase
MVVVPAANIQDDDGAKLVWNAIGNPFQRLKVILIFADSAYGKTGLPDGVKQCFGWILQTVIRPVGGKGFVVLPKRWICRTDVRVDFKISTPLER